MKILILSNPDSIHTQRWVKSLSENGFEIYLFGFNKCNSQFYSYLPNVTYSYIEITNKLKKRTNSTSFEKLKYLKSINTLKKIINNFRPDILHAHYATSYGLVGSLLNFKPFVVSVWGSDVFSFPKKSFLHKQVLKYVLNQASFLLSTSNIMSLEISKYTSREITVIPFGIDINIFNKKENIKSDKIIIGNVKTLLYNYGIDILIKAFNIVIKTTNNKNLLLYILGTGEDKIYFINLVKELKIEKNVKFIGYVENEKLPDYYSMFSMTVSPSLNESFGVVAIEAMGCQCPVIVSDAPGFVETVIDNVTGVIVPRNNVEETAKAIIKLLDDEKLRIEMGKSGREHVLKKYDWNSNVAKQVQVYKKIMNL